MTRSLSVWMHGRLAGSLYCDPTGRMSFTYAEAYVEEGGVPLSLALPLRTHTYRHEAARPFFAGLLPEGEQREKLARALGLSPRNDFSLLREAAGDCAGAVTLLPQGEAYQESEQGWIWLNEEGLRQALIHLRHRPLLTGERGIRASLAGPQPKIALKRTGDGFGLPLGSSPSTHILKPPCRDCPGTVENEALCMTLASAVGLRAAKVEVVSLAGFSCLLVERFDRGGPDQGSARVHQEDLCQALSIPHESKYQSEGGPGFAEAFELVRSVCRAPAVDLEQLALLSLFNLFIGNSEAHGKNLSFIHDHTGTRLAPFYDLLCTIRCPGVASHMAMSIGGCSEAESLEASHYAASAREWGLSSKAMIRRVFSLGQDILAALPALAPLSPPTAACIKARTTAILEKMARSPDPI